MYYAYWIFCVALVVCALEIRRNKGDLGRRSLFLAIIGGLLYFIAPGLIVLLLQLFFGPTTDWGLAAIPFAGLGGFVQIASAYVVAIASLSLAKRAKDQDTSNANGNSRQAARFATLIGWIVICIPVVGVLTRLFLPASQ